MQLILYSMGFAGKGGRCIGLTALPLSCANCLKILWAFTSWIPKGLSKPYRDSFTFFMWITVDNKMGKTQKEVPIPEFSWRDHQKLQDNRWSLWDSKRSAPECQSEAQYISCNLLRGQASGILHPSIFKHATDLIGSDKRRRFLLYIYIVIRIYATNVQLLS